MAKPRNTTAFSTSINPPKSAAPTPFSASLAGSYLSFSDSGLVNYSKDELIELFGKIKLMKEHSPFPVVNPTESLDEMQRHLRASRKNSAASAGTSISTSTGNWIYTAAISGRSRCARSGNGTTRSSSATAARAA
jgi:hypothetical protein